MLDKSLNVNELLPVSKLLPESFDVSKLLPDPIDDNDNPWIIHGPNQGYINTSDGPRKDWAIRLDPPPIPYGIIGPWLTSTLDGETDTKSITSTKVKSNTYGKVMYLDELKYRSRNFRPKQ